MPEMASPSLVGQVLDGRYRLTSKLGEGGMGEVYAAEHLHIDKRYAVKLLRQEIVSNKEAVGRFRQEARSASSIGHANIIAIEDFGELSDGRIYMCMEFLQGAPLNDIIKQQLPIDRALNILIQTGHGLAAAHAKGIVHRDMKPENIYVTVGPNNSDVPKLLDFGIAKVAGNDGQNNLTRTGTIFGTPYYMAPEQALGQQVDGRVDIYAMGVIMYEVFAGSLPFQGESFMGILTQHITHDPEPVVQRAAAAGRVLPPGLPEIISRCMQKDPARRFQTMDELVAALVEVYRSSAGAGMSTYMEAFPVPRTGAVAVPGASAGSQPTMMHGGPPPITGPGGAPSGPYQPAGMPSPTPMPMQGPPGSGMYQAGGLAPSTSGSGMYAADGSYALPKKGSKVGLIFAVIAILAVGGGAAAFIVLGNKKKDGADGGEGGSGAGTGSALVVAPADAAGAGDGTGAIAAGPVDAAGAAQVETPDAEVAVVRTEPDAGAAAPATVKVLVDSRNAAKFEIWENGKKVASRSEMFDVTPGQARTLLLKAKGFKDQTVVIDGTQERIDVKLERAGGGGTTTGPGPGSGGEKPPKLDCSQRLVNRTAACIAQYCDDADHLTDAVCLEP